MPILSIVFAVILGLSVAFTVKYKGYLGFTFGINFRNIVEAIAMTGFLVDAGVCGACNRFPRVMQRWYNNLYWTYT